MATATAKPEVFTRKASGLVRVMSPFSAFVYNILTMGLIFPWTYLWAPGALPGGQLVWGILLAMLLEIPIALSYEARMESCQLLNHVLADSMILHSHYKKHHWLMRGPTFYQLHLLLDKHADEQLELIDQIAERVQTLGGIAIADPRHVAEVTSIPRPRTAPKRFP